MPDTNGGSICIWTFPWNGSGVRVHFVPQYYNDNNFTAWLETQGITKREIGSHASITDTSQLLALDPKYIRMEKLAEGVPENGISGDPRRANAELGKRGLEFKIEAGVEQIRRTLATPQTKNNALAFVNFCPSLMSEFGTFRTWRDVRYSVALGGIADMDRDR